ncbi:hypothetical protein BJ508DRAFT_351160 [Ascobolus immersus RN42]|uniref:Mnd1 HTH domain-containing protein n=1 Tax=Ascobolus immersus RN42 TaxID=1160509 RepID=A0A3N4IHL3_ASCIM|nr:hypothetical protein BJ508DRAFT_351160 [Ascobolus immersus RN42]
MAPKTDPSPAKCASIISFFHTPPLTAYTIQQLEKQLPTNVPGLSGMQVKDFLTHLVGNSQICSEKIGSGNWYWHFPGAEGDGLKSKVDELRREVEGLRGNVEAAREEVESGRGVLEVEEERGRLERWLGGLGEEMEKLGRGGEGRVNEMRAEERVWRERVGVLEDNLQILLGFLKDAPEEAVEQLRAQVDIEDLE